MKDLYEPMYDFLVFNHGNEISKMVGFRPVDQIILDQIKDEGRQWKCKVLMECEFQKEVQDLGIEAVFSVDPEGFPRSVKFEKVKNEKN